MLRLTSLVLQVPRGGGGEWVESGQVPFFAGKCASRGWSVYYKPRSKWDGYSGQNAVVIDDLLWVNSL